MGIFKDLKWFLIQEKRSYLIGISLLVFVAILQLIPPKMIGRVVDHIEQGTLTSELLVKLMIFLLVLAAVLYVCRIFWRAKIYGASYRLARHYRNELFTHYTEMSPSFFQKYRTGDLMAHATNDIQALQQTFGNGILTLVDSLTVGCFVLLTMAFTISWKLTLIAILPLPIMAYATKKYGDMLHVRFKAAQGAFSDLNDQVMESVNGVTVIKSMGHEEESIEAFHKKSMDVVEKNIKVARVDALFDPTITVVVGASVILSLVFGSKFVLNGEMTIGDLISFNAYLGSLVWPLLAFGWLFNLVERGRASYDRINALLQVPKEITEVKDPIEMTECEDILYEVEHFTYPNSEAYALENLHLKVTKGETLGIVGKTGAGKTTLIRLLLRQYDVTEGNLRWGNHPLTQLSFDSIRKSIAYVPQENFLFSASIFENIAFANPAATKSEVEEAAKIACIHEDILGFPEGYQTLVGERGVSLSGGQKQRISIARALLAKTPILILDDCLSAVDARTEVRILQALKNERNDQTTFIISHRMSAVEHADQILVLEKGKVLHLGNHQQLMAEDTWYRQMVENQKLEASVEEGGDRE